MSKVIPFWRSVEYTDDGCSIYQCINCKGKWESRSEPGYTVWHDKVGKEFVLKAEPEYKPYFNFCPICGVAFKGPIRMEYDNHDMLGERRLRIQRATESRRMDKATPTFWWVIQQREVKHGEQEPIQWYDKHKASGDRFGAKEIYSRLLDFRSQDKDQDFHSANGPYPTHTKHQTRIVVMSGDEMNRKYPGWQGPREIY